MNDTVEHRCKKCFYDFYFFYKKRVFNVFLFFRTFFIF